jgi:hypothetical protein
METTIPHTRVPQEPFQTWAYVSTPWSITCKDEEAWRLSPAYWTLLAGGAMSMMEVAVSAAVGAVSGSALTILASYVQMRMSRREGQRQRAIGGTQETWHALHDRQRALVSLRLMEGNVSRAELDDAANHFGALLMQVSMMMRPVEFHHRLYRSGQILCSVPYCQDVRDAELLRITLEVVTHTQWVCAAYMMDQPIPDPFPHLIEYYRTIVPRTYWDEADPLSI